VKTYYLSKEKKEEEKEKESRPILVLEKKK